jgi:hypothetical protein
VVRTPSRISCGLRLPECDGWKTWGESNPKDPKRVRMQEAQASLVSLRSFLTYLRIPSTEYPCGKPEVRGPPSKNIHNVTKCELSNLKFLTEKGCTCTPRLLGYRAAVQADDSWLPGGYVIFILLEQVPGISFNDYQDFWALPREERDQFRKALLVSLR